MYRGEERGVKKQNSNVLSNRMIGSSHYIPNPIGTGAAWLPVYINLFSLLTSSLPPNSSFFVQPLARLAPFLCRFLLLHLAPVHALD